MVSETICIQILKIMLTSSFDYNPIRSSMYPTIQFTDSGIFECTVLPQSVYLAFMGTYDMAEVETALKWLTFSAHIMEGHANIRLKLVPLLILSPTGKAIAQSGTFSEREKRMIYQEEDPYAVFIAHQFSPEDQDLVDHIRDTILKPIGLTLIDGKADGLEQFRDGILKKIKKCRFFLCLLTPRVELKSGEFASSTWLYQETGAALAYGKSPLILVQQGIDQHYVGEFQKVYQYETFSMSNYPKNFQAIARRFKFDLELNNIPLPPPLV